MALPSDALLSNDVRCLTDSEDKIHDDNKHGKTGRPRKLISSSQRRQLLRLYLLTNLSVPNISKIVSRKLPKNIGLRTIQDNLKDLLQTRPNLLRPKDKDGRRRRLKGFYHFRTASAWRHGKRGRRQERVQHTKTQRREIRQEAPNTIVKAAQEKRHHLANATQLQEPSEPWTADVSTTPLPTPVPKFAELCSFSREEAVRGSRRYTVIRRGSQVAVYPTETLPTKRDSETSDSASEADETPSISMWSASEGLQSVVNSLSFCSTVHKDDVIDAMRLSFKSSVIPRQQTSICSPVSNSSKERDYRNCKVSSTRDLNWKGNHKLPGAFISEGLKTYVLRRYFLTLDVTWSDRFNNTTLHVAAALEPTYVLLEELMDGGAGLNAVNTAGQTFMHVLDPRKIRKDIRKLLLLIKDRGFDFGITDHLGQNIFHELSRKCTCFSVVSIFRTSDRLWQRDSSGRTTWDEMPFWRCGGEKPAKVHPKRFVFAAYGLDASPHATIPWLDDLPHITQMIKNIRESDHDCIKLDDKVDEYGRNALHLLVDIPFDHRTTVGKDSAERSRHVCCLRKRCANALLSYGKDSTQILKVHDVSGRTPLVALVGALHIADEELAYLVELFIRRGANVQVRNRDGESPLHIATRLGHIAVTRVLTKYDANVNARRTDGQSIIAAGAKWAAKVKEDLVLHARIMACVCLLADHGALLEPNDFDEWDRRPNDSSKSREQYDRTRSEIYTKCE